MNMEEQILPIVPFGKYKDKSVLELLADEKYVEWLKQQSWFSNQTQIYNIVVHQRIPTTNNSKTPEHNKLQNMFLDKNNQEKLLSKLFNINLHRINNLFADEDIVRCFGENIIPEIVNNFDNTTIKFEDKFNWDLVLYYEDYKHLTVASKNDNELIDKEKYKEQYDIEENAKYNNNLLLIDLLIEGRKKLDQEGIQKYDEKMKEYLDKYEKYEDDLRIYLQQKPQNDKDVTNYDNKLKMYQTKKNNFIIQQTKIICQELGINYDNFVNWNIINTDRDTTHTTEEKKQLREIVDDKLKPFIKEFERLNAIPHFVKKIEIPIKPSLPKKYCCNEDISMFRFREDCEIYELHKKVCRISNVNVSQYHLYSVDKLNECKKEYENKYKKEYENNFNKHYEKYRLQYYEDIINKYCDNNVYVQKINENQYKISIKICNYNYAVCCELKPTLSDDYPVVLRKLKTQIELTQNDNTTFKKLKKIYILIVGSFTSIHVSKEQLITIFKQSNIKIIFTDEIYKTSKSLAICNTTTNAEQVLFENKLFEENKVLTDNLLQTQQKLLQAEEKIKQLEEEILSLKTQKQSKSIKDYFNKK